MLLRLFKSHKKLVFASVIILTLVLSYWLQTQSVKKRLASADKNFDGSVSQYGVVIYRGKSLNVPKELPRLDLQLTSLNEYQVVDKLSNILQTNFVVSEDSVWQSSNDYTLIINQEPKMFSLTAAAGNEFSLGFSSIITEKITTQALGFGNQLLGAELSVVNTSYFVGEYELVEANPENASVVTLELAQTYAGYPVAIGRTSPLRITYNNQGSLIKAEIVPDFYQIQSGSNLRLLTVEEAVKQIKNNVGYIRYANNDLYEQVDLSKILSLTIDEAKVYYQPNASFTSAEPSYLFTGSVEVPTSSLRSSVELVMSAKKE